MTVFLIILRCIGILLAVILLLLLLVLFVPIAYAGTFAEDDPEGREEPDWQRLKDGFSGGFDLSWMFGLVRGWGKYPAERPLSVRILFFEFDPLTFLKKEKTEKPDNEAQRQLDEDRKKKEAEKTEPGEKGSGDETSAEDAAEEKSISSESFRERAEKIPDRVEQLAGKVKKAYRNAVYYLRVLQKPYSAKALEQTKRLVKRLLPAVLPRRYRIEGTLGLGDPAACGKVMEVLALLYPYTAGNIEIEPAFLEYRFDLTGSFQGRIFIGRLLVIFLRFWLDRNVRHFVSMMRKEPQKRKNKKRDREQGAVKGAENV